MHTEEYNNVNIMRKKMKIPDTKRKQDAKLKSLSKDQERREREPSCRLGKNAKKFAGRITKILEIEDKSSIESVIEDKDLVGIKSIRIKLMRPKRKPGHRKGDTYNRY